MMVYTTSPDWLLYYSAYMGFFFPSRLSCFLAFWPKAKEFSWEPVVLLRGTLLCMQASRSVSSSGPPTKGKYLSQHLQKVDWFEILASSYFCSEYVIHFLGTNLFLVPLKSSTPFKTFFCPNQTLLQPLVSFFHYSCLSFQTCLSKAGPWWIFFFFFEYVICRGRL